MSAPQVIDLKEAYACLHSAWGVLKDEKSSKPDREYAAETVMKYQDIIKTVDSTFKVIDLRQTKYASFLKSNITLQNTKEPTNFKELKSADIDFIKSETRKFFEVKKLVKFIADSEFANEDYGNGPSVGQATENVYAKLIN